MNITAMFVLGLLMGWLAEWAVDWFCWGGRIGTIAKENILLKERVTSLEAHPSINRKVNPRPLSAKGIPITDQDGNDNFQAIKGIGHWTGAYLWWQIQLPDGRVGW